MLALSGAGLYSYSRALHASSVPVVVIFTTEKGRLRSDVFQAGRGFVEGLE
jgi:hypothetical protein